MDGDVTYSILIDSVRRRDRFVSYLVQAARSGATAATWMRVLAGCQLKVRAILPDNSPPGARLDAMRVGAHTREARELATACEMPEGPRGRWFAGFVVTPDGVVAAPHARTVGCTSFSTGLGAKRRELRLVANEDDVTLLKMTGTGNWAVMPATDAPLAQPSAPVTMLGVSGVEPRVSAGYAVRAGSNGQDSGWPQVYMLADGALREGIAWNSAGAAIGLGLSPQGTDTTHAYVRLLPASEIRLRMARHGLNWAASGPRTIDPEAAMRLALAATVSITCEGTR